MKCSVQCNVLCHAEYNEGSGAGLRDSSLSLSMTYGDHSGRHGQFCALRSMIGPRSYTSGPPKQTPPRANELAMGAMNRPLHADRFRSLQFIIGLLLPWHSLGKTNYCASLLATSRPHYNHSLHSSTSITPALNHKICVDHVALRIAVPVAIPRYPLR